MRGTGPVDLGEGCANPAKDSETFDEDKKFSAKALARARACANLHVTHIRTCASNNACMYSFSNACRLLLTRIPIIQAPLPPPPPAPPPFDDRSGPRPITFASSSLPPPPHFSLSPSASRRDIILVVFRSCLEPPAAPTTDRTEATPPTKENYRRNESLGPSCFMTIVDATNERRRSQRLKQFM